MRSKLEALSKWLSGLSFKTGLIVLGVCVPFYLLSFAVFVMPISIALRGVLWAVLFGFAKAFQYTGILILGKEGIRRLKSYWRRKDRAPE